MGTCCSNVPSPSPPPSPPAAAGAAAGMPPGAQSQSAASVQKMRAEVVSAREGAAATDLREGLAKLVRTASDAGVPDATIRSELQAVAPATAATESAPVVDAPPLPAEVAQLADELRRALGPLLAARSHVVHCTTPCTFPSVHC